LTLQKALDICRANEATASQLKTLSSGATSREIVDQEVFADPHLNHEKAKMTNVVFNTNIIRTVQFMVWSATTVGKRTIFPKFVEVDPFQRNIAVHSLTHDESDHSGNLFIGMIQCITTNKLDWKVSILVNHQRTSFKSAQCNVISKS